ncbi:hypothetical protein KLP28_07230 [Nocardioidaceae bacterium]|nr:hypothetical protein KLP28_07230 [Nocardioidaceae bacterium]
MRRAGQDEPERPGGTGADFPLSHPGFRSTGVRLGWVVAVMLGLILLALLLLG